MVMAKDDKDVMPRAIWARIGTYALALALLIVGVGAFVLLVVVKPESEGEAEPYPGPRVRAFRVAPVATHRTSVIAYGTSRAGTIWTATAEVGGRVVEVSELFEVGAELASPDPVARGTRTISPKHVEAVEAAIDEAEARLEPLGQFILPAGTRAAAGLHLARAVCRRAERRAVTAMREGEGEISAALSAYLNRLGDLLFVLARLVNAEAGRPDVPWRQRT